MRTQTWIVSLIAAMCSAGLARADVPMPFTESWSGENIGDNANQLTWWSYESAYGSAPASQTFIVDAGGGDRALNMNPSGSTASTGIRSQRATVAQPILSVACDTLLTTDGNGAGVIGFTRHGLPLYGYVLAISRDGSGGAWIDLRRFDGDLNDSFTVGPVQVAINPTQRHRYELRATFSPGQIAFAVYLDNSPTPLTSPHLQPIDFDPHDFTAGADFALASNFGQQAYFDDFYAETIIPEPSTLALLAVGGLLMIARPMRRVSLR